MRWKHYLEWIASTRSKVDKDKKTLSISTCNVTYTDIGDGNPLLYIHGSIGGYGSGPMFVSWLCAHGYRLITPSRPGFSGVPLTCGETPEAQADYLRDVLAELGITSCSIIAHSGGGPVALSFLSRHSAVVEKVIFLTAIGHNAKMASPLLVRLFYNRFFIYCLYLVKRMSSQLYLWACVKYLELDWCSVRDNQSHRDDILFHIETSLNPSLHRTGLLNDIKQYQRSDNFTVEKFHVPALVIYSCKDKRTGGTHGPFLAERFHDSNIVHSDRGGHHPLVSSNSVAIKEKILKFLNE